MNQSNPQNSQLSSNDLSEHKSRTALVLGGGGSAGNAWLIGVIAGLMEAGLDVTAADLVVGTSAGATAAAQITAASATELFTSILAVGPSQDPRSATPPAAQSAKTGQVANIQREGLERISKIIALSENAVDMRRRMGAAALEMAASSDGSDRWRGVVAARLPKTEWPQRKVLITAVDARSGEPVVFDRDSEVDLVDAVAASTSSGAAYSIGDRRYIDGGYRRNENADLAAGYERVLVMSPLGGKTLHPLGWGMQLAAQVDELRAGGSRVETILPDRNSLNAFGDNMMDLSTRLPAARAGYDQGTSLAEQLADFWR